MNSSEHRPDCTNQCKSVQHGEIITAAISKRSISDYDLCSFLNFLCSRCESVVDSVGRTALQVAASCGRLELVKWLIHSRHADINLKDRESGYTALHRSIFYGKMDVAVELIKLGASTSDLDADCLTAIEHSMKDGLRPFSGTNGGELYSWGSNNNNLLGPQPSRQSPELLDIFHKEFSKESVRQMCIGQFHSIIVTESGKALSCGHGQGGRLGLGDEKAVVTPQLLSFSNGQKGEVISCIQASISRDHSIFLCCDGNVYTCGLNTYYVLGQLPPPEIVLVPKPIKHLSKEISGVCAGQFHSVVWGPEALYTWGLNAGQLGHKVNDKKKEQFVVTPRIVNIVNDINITCVAASNGATAVCTKRGDVYLLHEYQCRKIASRLLNAVQISIVGGKLESPLLDRELTKELHKELKVVVLTNTGNLLLWQELDQQLCRCIYSINRAIIVRQVSMNLNEMLLVSNCGEAFKGIIKPRKKAVTNSTDKNTKNSFHNFLDKEDCVVVSLQKISRIHRAVSIQSDLKGRDYCVVQALPYKTFTFPQITKSEMKHDLETLLKESDENDNIHDVIFKVRNRIFPAHQYIVTKKSAYFEKILNDKYSSVDLGNINPDIFEQFLEFVYTGECQLSTCGVLKSEGLRKLCHVKEHTKKTDDIIIDTENIPADMSAYEYYSKEDKEDNKQNGKHSRNPVRLLHELAKKFECTTLQKILSNLDMNNYTINHKTNILTAPISMPKFNRLDFPNLHDVTVKCRDGKELRAHKCVLSARMEYFSNLFSTRWGGDQTSEVNLPYAKSTVEALLEFLYTDSLSSLKDIEHDNLFKVLVLADQLFVLRLKDQCEMLLSDTLTLKNVVQILSFAHLYNAEKLKYCCMKFIISNITPLLESRMLDDLEVDLLKELSEFYFNENENVWCRVITPYSIALQDEIILSIGTAYPVDLTCIAEVTPVRSSQKKRHRVHKTSERHVSISVENDTSLEEILQFPDEPESVPESRDLPTRIKSIMLASTRMNSESVEHNFTKLVSQTVSGDFSSSLEESFDFPELSSPPNHPLHGFSPKSPPQRVVPKLKMVKLSQKQRKKLSSESHSEIVAQSPPVSTPPKNPWKPIPDVTGPLLKVDAERNIGDIILDEKKQKENLIKLKSKPLVCTQIEDKAIDDLHKFYNTENVLDEVIIIERVNSGAIASPVWVPRAKQIC
ncbi:unnamed protein product [Phaedon cochleariae]|uniref:BTB domain-containing protein n=1 Tax=Phaedon cochleariae TaxID=80249 RepID=A0A9N9X3P6_PHACE|nr:unnamed protein product [Phaedon cochleariae]